MYPLLRWIALSRYNKSLEHLKGHIWMTVHDSSISATRCQMNSMLHLALEPISRCPTSDTSRENFWKSDHNTPKRYNCKELRFGQGMHRFLILSFKKQLFRARSRIAGRHFGGTVSGCVGKGYVRIFACECGKDTRKFKELGHILHQTLSYPCPTR